MKVPSSVFFSCFFLLSILSLSFIFFVGILGDQRESLLHFSFFLLFFSLLLFLYDIHSVPGLEKGGGGRVLS